ncbi:pilus assembly protein PilQ [Pseudomonas oryzihabitans]|nr:pilus assembly protein PilQ [Pseudomonas psychrotolerans]
MARDLVADLAPLEGAERVLTAEGGPWGSIKPHLRQFLVLLEAASPGSDALLLVSAQHLRDPFVMAFMNQLDQAGLQYQLRSSTLSEIKAHYQRVDSSRGAGMGMTDSAARQQDVMRILGLAQHAGASDVHFVVGRDITRIHFRVHGLLYEHAQVESRVGRELCFALYNTMCDVAEEHFQPEISQNARVKNAFVAQLGLFGARVATRPLVDGPLVVLRLLSDDQTLQSHAELGFHPTQIPLIDRLQRLPYGINLITGPTGSGKSKTLQVTLNLIAAEVKGTRHILTLEDPPEYPIRANQSPLGQNETWDQAITTTLRLDPDILMPGEVRDLPSAVASFRGGMTGHQLWSTLHTNNAVASLQRLIDMGCDQSLVTDPALMTGLINQSLLPVLCPECAQPLRSGKSSVEPGLLERLQGIDLDQVKLKGPGCSHCRQSGVVRRTVVAEILLPTYGFMRCFRQEGAGEARSYWVKEMGGMTKIMHARSKVAAGLIDPRMAESEIGPLDFDRYVLEQHHAG